MAEQTTKQSEKKKKSKASTNSKVTTGAWWKSPLLTDGATDTQPADESSSTGSPAPQLAAEPAKPSRPGRSAKRGRRSGKQNPQVKQPVGGEDPAASPPAAEPAAATVQQAEPTTPVAEAGDGNTPAGTDSPAGEEKKDERRSRRSRGRRGGRNRKAAKQKKEQEAAEQQEKQSETSAHQTKQRPESQKQRQEDPDDELPPDEPDEIDDQEDEDEPSGADKGQKTIVKLLINAEEPEECRLALLENGRLESLYVSTVSRVQTRNNIYKARVVAIEPNLQAAFVDYGTEKNGFLTFSEIHPEYYRQNISAEIKALVEQQQWKKLSISDVLEKGQEMLVQVVKEEVGKKGANMTTYLSLPGRCVVLMPGSESEGVSRKISGEERRNELREILNSLQIPEGIGWIVRTASVDITKTALTKDVRYLLRLWKEIKEKGQAMEGVGLLYQDHNCVMRFLREHFDPDIQEILVDDEAAMEKVEEFIDMLPAKQRKVRVKLHKGSRPVFNHYSVEDQIESIYQPRVSLPSGGSIVIEPTEALVSIDVNSGSTGKGQNFEETIFTANMEAATELARQLRLRDLGGLIVIDFIDMRSSRNIREVEKQLKNAMKRDKAKVDMTRISRFGLMQISRQKLGSPIESGNYRVCEHCRGRGTVRSVETQALFYLRRIQTGASRKQVVRVNCRFPIEIAQYLLNNKRHDLTELEEQYQTGVVIVADPTMKPLEHEITFDKQEKEETQKKQA